MAEINTPLIVMDPVDKRRNAAAAVTKEAYSTFIASSRWFLRRPSEGFFFPSFKIPAVSDFLNLLNNRGSIVIAVTISCPNVPADILWGEIYKSLNRMGKLLADNGFAVKDMAAWTDEKNAIAFLLEVETGRIKNGVLHMGPKVCFIEEAQKFVGKYLDNKKVLAGPFIKDDRWYVELCRDHMDAKELLEQELPKVRLSTDIGEQLKKGFRIYVDAELGSLYDGERGRELFKFVRKRPLWLR